jgi:hypothetical protein
MRAVFIALGAALIAAFSFMFLLFGLVPREQAIPAAAGGLGASLLVPGVGAGADEGRMAAQLADRAGCSVLAVRAAGPVVPARLARGRGPARATTRNRERGRCQA